MKTRDPIAKNNKRPTKIVPDKEKKAEVEEVSKEIPEFLTRRWNERNKK